ncbi:Neuroglian-like protein [Dinothrombium tinctorium]|uniref:Neuroglian-like protein n=1 Tax=Dinothrombium tinctorium TaxID=1965070 RepID=A0A3S3NG48_9ACAR|nr:Neuroglian-like protein [Dinothrombium tinctorium]
MLPDFSTKYIGNAMIFQIQKEAHNKKGQAHTVATEVIGFSGEARPSQAPRNFLIRVPIEAKSALFVWDPVPDSSINGHFKGYKIQTWTADEGEDRMREVVVPPNVTTALVDIFKIFSKNVFQVLAFTDMFNGPPSDTTEFNTPESVPGPVSMLSAVRIGSSALYLV